MKPKILSIVTAALALAGCASAQEISQTCRTYGFRPGTDGHAACSMQLHQTQQAQQVAVAALVLGAAVEGASIYADSRYGW